MKRYERSYSGQLTPRSNVIVRVDGKAFHTFTKGCQKPFDEGIMQAMDLALVATAEEMQGFKLGYTQSDEATFLISDFENIDTQGWFDYDLNKIVSISASLFTAYFNLFYGRTRRFDQRGHTPAFFDSRAFVVPEGDAPNIFVWRQQDWERNSVQMLARAHFSHRQCHGKKIPDLHEMLHEISVNWTKDCTPRERNGSFYWGDTKTLTNNKETYDTLMGDCA